MKNSACLLLFRHSGNVSEFRVFAEARTKGKAKKILQKSLKEVNKKLSPLNFLVLFLGTPPLVYS